MPELKAIRTPSSPGPAQLTSVASVGDGPTTGHRRDGETGATGPFVPEQDIDRQGRALTVQFGLTEDQQLFQETTRKFLEDTCPLDVVRQIAEEQPGGFDRAWWRRGAELGWVSMLVAEEHGGGSVSGGGLADLGLVAEEVGQLVSPGPLVPTNVVAGALSRAGGSNHSQHLAGLVGGETVAAWSPPEFSARAGEPVGGGPGQ